MSWTPTHIVLLISVAGSFVFLFCSLFESRKLRGSVSLAVTGWQSLSKVAVGLLLAVVLVAYLAKFSTSSLKPDKTYVASLVASIPVAIWLGLVSALQPRYSISHFDLATIYLVFSILCDVVLVTIPSGISVDGPRSLPIVVRSIVHSVALVLICCTGRPKSSISKPLSPEEKSGILSRIFFFWINPILFQGYKEILTGTDLPTLSQNLKPKATRQAALRAWDRRSRPETKRALPLALYRCLKQPFLAAILPRLFLIVFKYSQPILIKESIRYVTTSYVITSSAYGYWIIVSGIAVYVGLAVSTAIYQHRLNRLKLQTKSALIGLIHEKAMRSPSMLYEDGEATTLMSTDVDGLEGIAQMFHETWAQILEVAIGVVLLSREVGWIWPLPLVLIFPCSRMSRYVAKNMKSRQRDWNKATQHRVVATSTMLSSMKIVKMLGLQTFLASRVEGLRMEELHVASKVRWINVYYNSSANALGIFSPAVTLALFTIIVSMKGGMLDAETAFTTIAILGMVTHPANMVMTIVPQAIGAFAGVERIQNYLLRPSLRDERHIYPPGDPSHDDLAISIQQLTIGDKQPILEDIDIEFPSGSLSMISGPVGCGKSALLQAILGEMVPVHGAITVSTKRIGYCAQMPWLPRGTIKEAILHNAREEHVQWYRQVVNACCLAHDFEMLPKGDQTEIGSRGLNLSGGQRQRVALARALYARCEIALLDDPFSALDGETEHRVFSNLFGPLGVFKMLKTTVVVVSNSTQHYPEVDKIIILGNRKVEEQGTWQTIQSKGASLAKFIPPKDAQRSESDLALSKPPDRLSAQLRARDEAEVDLTRQTGDVAVYEYYFRFIGWTNLLLLGACTASTSIFMSLPQYWLKLWTESEANRTVFYICGFLIISVISWSSTSAQMWATLVRVAPRSGMRLHQRLLQTVTCAPLSYFSETDTGSILNRFSQDIQLIDKQLPNALATVGTQIFKLLTQLILLFLAQKYLLLTLPFCTALVYFVQKIYLRTSRQLRFLELESRATVFSSFLESVDGLATLRSFHWVPAAVRQNSRSVSQSQRPEFLLLALQRWLNIVLDLLAAGIAVSLITLAVALRGSVSGGQIGMALNVVLVANTTLLKLVENWTGLEVALGAVARTRGLEREVAPEDAVGETFLPVDNWPTKGEIEITGVTAAYHHNAIALRNVSLHIKPGQKIIVCGRTGSGKSSLLLTFLRLLPIHSGTINIDRINITSIPHEVLRQRAFVTVAQDPLVLANEPIRLNLDPERAVSDEILVEKLTSARLWNIFAASRDLNRGVEAENGGGDEGSPAGDALFVDHLVLDRKVSDFSVLSAGQAQLFALARALVKVEKLRQAGVRPVVLLDEVTASVDAATETVIHEIVEEEISRVGFTVVMVAHRLGSLREWFREGRDAVVWMREGVVEGVEGHLGRLGDGKEGERGGDGLEQE